MKLRSSLTRRTLLGSCVAAVMMSSTACGGGDDAFTQLGAGAVAAGDIYSAQAGQTMLANGGNAVDAAVATAFALAVTYPEAGNIGGGGFMTVHVNKKDYFLDYREVAPAATSANFYAQFKTSNGQQDPLSSLRGAQSVAVPGTVRGLWEAHHRFGRLSWQQVIAPAISLAESGHVVAAKAVFWRDFAEANLASPSCPANLTEYFGSKLKAGELFKQLELADTLRRISVNGPDEFYTGHTADLIVAAMTQDGGKGVITKADLAEYRAVWRNPLSFDWNGMRVITAPPPSSGGIALAQLLGMKSALNQTLFAGHTVNSAHYIHLTAEMMKRVFADRAQFLGDPAFTDVPVAGLLDPAYISARAAEVNPNAITPTSKVAPGTPKFHTTHFSVIDKWGNAVSNTFTLNGPYGSGVIVRGGGFALNDEMDDFVTVPGQPNLFGVIGSDANAVAPGKRPLSSMTPTIVLKGDTPVMVVGTPGGSRIFTHTYQVLTNVYDYHMDIATAVSNPRFHHQLPQGGSVEEEPFDPFPAALKSQVEALGYTVTRNFFDTDVQAIQVANGMPIPVADPRGRGVAIQVK